MLCATSCVASVLLEVCVCVACVGGQHAGSGGTGADAAAIHPASEGSVNVFTGNEHVHIDDTFFH